MKNIIPESESATHFSFEDIKNAPGIYKPVNSYQHCRLIIIKHHTLRAFARFTLSYNQLMPLNFKWARGEKFIKMSEQIAGITLEKI